MIPGLQRHLSDSAVPSLGRESTAIVRPSFGRSV